MALPKGYMVNYRYRDEWVADDIPSDGAEIEGEEATMVAVSESGWGAQYFPLRKGVIEKVDVEEEGREDIFHVYISLDDSWPDYEEVRGTTPQPFSAIDSDREDSYMFFGSGVVPVRESDGAWRDIVETMTNNGEFENSLFYRIRRICEIENLSDDDRLSTGTVNAYTTAYTLSPYTNYAVEVLFDFGNDPPEGAESSQLRLTNTEFIDVFPLDTRLGFKLDKKWFSLNSKGASSRSIEYVSFNVDGNVEGADFELPLILEPVDEK